MGSFAEDVFFDGAPDEDFVLAKISSGSALGEDEVPIRSDQYAEAVAIHYGDPFHLAIRRYLVEQVLRVPAVVSGNAPPEIKRFVERRWIQETAPDIMGEAWTLGLTAVETQADDETGWPVPHVYRMGLGNRYKITTRERKRKRATQYRFYHVEREPGKRGQIRRSKKVKIYSGFDADPHPDTGDLTSVVASLILKHREYEENHRIARVALVSMARPMILMETTRTSQGMDPETAGARAPVYGGQDWVPIDHRQRVAAAAADLDVASRQMHAFWNEYYDQIEAMAASGERSVHQAHLNMIPMPADHRSASYQRASVRTDWKTLAEIYEETVTSAYGLQRAHLQSGLGRLQVSETLTNAALVNAINRWRDDLSRVFTDMFQRAFGFDGEITFPKEVNDSPDGLFAKWERGLLTWEGYKTLIGEATGIDPRHMESKAPKRPEPAPIPTIAAPKPTGAETKKRKRASGSV